ncbi:unnamed protein product [Calypogeia fissa]
MLNAPEKEDELAPEVKDPEAVVQEEEENGKWWRSWTKPKPKAEAKDGNVEENKSEKAAEPKQPTVSVIQLYSFADKLDYVLMCFGTIGAAVHGVALPLLLYLFGQILNKIGHPVNVQHTSNKYALYFVWISLVCLVSSWLEVAFWMHTGQRQSAKLRAKYLEALLRQDVAYFDVDTNTGDIVSSIATDPLALQNAISEKTGHFFHHMATFIASFIIGFSTEWRVSIVTIAMIPCIVITGGFYAFFVTRYSTKASAAFSEAGSIAQQAISQIRTVHSFVAEEKFVKTYRDALRKTLKLGTDGSMAKGIGMGAIMAVSLFGYAVLLTYGGIVVRKGQANGAAVFSTILNIVIGSTSLAQAMANLTPFGEARASAFKIFQVIRHSPSINMPEPNAESPETVEGHIELRNVDFYYPARPDVPVFQNFSLIAPPGQSVAIVGSSGSGKSTVVSLIERFYDPDAGEVLLDGVNLKKLDLKWLRKQIGLVNQEPALFATTIAANIAYGSETATQTQIEEAATVANAYSFIKQLPLGYKTQVGERGVQLSGGQRQRIAIARAIVRNPRVLLLDEATSALDARSEQAVQEAIDSVMVGRTTVLVAHRLSTIRNADTIAVVEQGRIVESGTHQELMSKEDGAYSALVHLQELSTTNEADHAESPLFSPSRLWTESPRHSISSLSPRRSISTFSPFRYQMSTPKSPIGVGGTTEVKAKEMQKSKASLKRLIVLTKKDWQYGMAAIVGSVGAGWIGPLCAFFLGSVLADYYTADKQLMKRNITKFSWFFAALGFWAIFINNVQHYSVGVIGERLVNRIRLRTFAKILRNELGWFDEVDNNSSQLVARLASDAATARTVLGDRGSLILQNITNILVTFSISFALQWKMAAVMSAVFPVIICAYVFEQSFLVHFGKGQSKAYEQATQVAGEAVGNIRTVAAFNAEDKVLALFTTELEGPSKQSFWKAHMVGISYGLSQFLLYSSSNALGFWYAGKLVATGQATFNSVVKPYLLMLVCAYAIGETLSVAPDIAKGGQAIASLFSIMDRVSKIDADNPDGDKVDKISGDIELKQVTMVYPSRPNVTVLRDVSLEVSSGQSLALVGASGCGKSSIISLIERFYDPSSGQIFIDGKDIKNYNLRFLRQHIGLVQQEPALFATTLHENIVFGKTGASEAEVIEAAKAANAHNFISSLPQGYQTLVGERGVQLSGGQKQRVAIARAVLRDPTIFLLDEATSALDAESEKVVQEAIDRLMEGRTTIMVAHRLSTIRGADSIAVMRDGSIVERGSHTDLLSKRGTYYRLVKLQRRNQKQN